jgi:hypothetical protein
MSTDREFDRVFEALAHYNRRPRKTAEQIEAERREAHRNDPRHQKALERRRKRKRGGPK